MSNTSNIDVNKFEYFSMIKNHRISISLYIDFGKMECLASIIKKNRSITIAVKNIEYRCFYPLEMIFIDGLETTILNSRFRCQIKTIEYRFPKHRHFVNIEFRGSSLSRAWHVWYIIFSNSCSTNNRMPRSYSLRYVEEHHKSFVCVL